MTRYLTAGGVTRSVPEWAELTGIKQDTLRARLRDGWDDERAVTTLARGWGRGDKSTRQLAGVWSLMVRRCHDPDDPNYHRYGGRGIAVCAEWRESFWTFADDVDWLIGPRPSPGHSIDRRDNDGGYAPGNIRWATQSQQCRNTRVNRILTVGGRSATVAEWAELTGLGWSTIRERLRGGWSAAAAVGTPVRRRGAA